MPKIGDYQVSNNNSSKFQGASIRVKLEGVILAIINFDSEKRASDPLTFIRKKYLVDEYAKEKREELISALLRARVPECDIEMLLAIG